MPRPDIKPLSSREIERLRAMSASRYTIRRMAIVLNRTPDTIRAALKAEGLSGPRRAAWSNADLAQLARAREAGTPVAQIARELGRTEPAVMCQLERIRHPSTSPRAQRRQHTTRRPCLACRRLFNSEGPHHRLCDACRRNTGTVFTTPARVIA